MVGVPGKSKGCHTCRRRKIACDLIKPDCLKCAKSGRVCEGYNRGLVFLNRTSEGLRRRAPLEEAQPRNKFVSQSSRALTVAQISKIPPEMDAMVVMMKQFEGMFLEIYLPSDSRLGSDLSGAWLQIAASLDEPGEALKHALRGLFVTRAGRTKDDEVLTVKGKAAYGQALRELNKALSSPKVAYKDETLAACNVLALYELFESTTNNFTAHNKHKSGMVRLVATLDPNQPSSPMKQALVRDVKYPAMALSILHRKTTGFDYRTNYDAPWPTVENIPERLHQLGLTVAALLESIDNFLILDHPCRSSEERIFALSSLIYRCTVLDTEFLHWYLSLAKTHHKLPLYWSTKDMAHSNIHSEPFVWTAENPVTISFPSLHVAHLLIEFWGLRITLSMHIDFLHRKMAKFAQPPTISRSEAYGMPSTDATRANHNANLTSYPIRSAPSPNLPTSPHDPNPLPQIPHARSNPFCLHLATLIMMAIPFCTAPAAGIPSTQKCLFPLRMALLRLQVHPGAQLDYCAGLYAGLTSEKGLKLARDIASLPQGWRALEEDLRGSV